MRTPNNESLLQVLRGAHSLILRGWCRGHIAVDADGRASHWPEAGPSVAFSLVGAVRTAGNSGLAAEHALRLLKRLTQTHNLAEWNDHPLRIKRDVLDLLGKAMAEVGGRAPRRGGWRIAGVAS